MPRSYSFDHFQVPKREPNERAGTSDEIKAATAGKGESAPPPAATGGVQYGQAHAETVRLAVLHAARGGRRRRGLALAGGGRLHLVGRPGALVGLTRGNLEMIEAVAARHRHPPCA